MPLARAAAPRHAGPNAGTTLLSVLTPCRATPPGCPRPAAQPASKPSPPPTLRPLPSPQSGGFTTDILTKLDPSALMAGLGGAGGQCRRPCITRAGHLILFIVA